ncbi:MAG: iron chelate uptake ABC transporter family permease subunit, partial [Eubacteriaceae bacterium]
ASAALGAVFVLSCDFISRMIFAPYELPVGIMMSAIGGPFFIYLLFKQRRGRLYD